MLSLPWDLWKKLVSKHSVKGEPTHAIAPMEFVPRKKNESLYTVLKGNSHMPSFPWDLFQRKKKKRLVSKHSVKGELTHAIAPARPTGILSWGPL